LGQGVRLRRSFAALMLVVANLAVVQLTAGPAAAADVAFWTQDFNSVTLPGVPEGWTTACVGCQAGDPPWQTFNGGGTVVNGKAMARPKNHVTDNRLESAPFIYPTGAGLYFEHSWKFAWTLQSRPDGGVVEIQIGTGAWTDIITAGGSFTGISGFYSGPISSPSNPLHNRQAFMVGNGDFFITTIALPASGVGETVRVRWRLGTDNNGAGDDGTTFWTIDNVRLTGPESARQTISFTSTAPVLPPIGATYTPTATATSGLPVTFSIAPASSSVCSIGAADEVTFNATGSCVIRADQAGSASFAGAAQMTQTVDVAPDTAADQTISFTSTPPVKPHVVQAYTPRATATSGLAVTFTIAPSSASVCSIDGGNVVWFNSPGSCVIQADQAGNAAFAPAPQVTQTVKVYRLSNPGRPGVVNSSTTWKIRFTLDTGPPRLEVTYGTKPLVPVAGDWDGDGARTPGTFERGVFQLRNTFTSGGPDVTFTFGDPRGFPVAADFDGNGIEDVAVVRNGTWQVRYLGNNAPADATFSFGPALSWPTVVPVAGDWDGDTIAGIGYMDRSTGMWYLRNSVSAGPPDITPFEYQPLPASYPIVGDWDGDYVETIGVKSATGTGWALSNTNTSAAPTINLDFGTGSSDLPFTWW
jgi:hypothetical protein